jgi:hypothetical protein
VFHTMAYSWMVHLIGDFWANVILTYPALWNWTDSHDSFRFTTKSGA